MKDKSLLATVPFFAVLFYAMVASATDPVVVGGIPQPSSAPSCASQVGFVADPNGNVYLCNGTDLRAISNVKGNGVFATATATATATVTPTATPTVTATFTPGG